MIVIFGNQPNKCLQAVRNEESVPKFVGCNRQNGVVDVLSQFNTKALKENSQAFAGQKNKK